ncbi:MAG: DUF4286 family protein [Marinifilaceae bacterium]
MRIIYNTTFIIPDFIEENWLAFIREEHVAIIKNDSDIDDVLFTKVEIEQPEGETYSLQVIFNSAEKYDNYLATKDAIFVQALIERFKDQYLCFSSTMREL